MQVLLTGIPGSGKTLYMISEVDKISKRDNRPVFYYGIKDLTLPWIELTKEQVFNWHSEFPPNAIFCLDEGQEFFRPTSISRELPPHVTALETHRHGGIDIWLTTQDPSFVHSHWRKLAGRHCHFLNKFGMKAATIYEWREVQEDPKKGRYNALQSLWIYPKEYFGVYKSAEVHTMKLAIPKKIIFAISLLVLIPAGILFGAHYWYKNSFMSATGKNAKGEGKSSTVSAPAAPSVNYLQTASAAPDVPVDPKVAYLKSRTPVVEGMPHTAPVYNSITAPKRVPAPFACVSSKSRCQCYTDGGTRLPQVPEHTCLRIVEHGFYADWQIPGPTPLVAAGGGTRTERAAQAEP